MSDALKALCRETKALIVVSEFEAKRMPLFQLRAVLEQIVRDDEERKVVIDLVERDLRATGYPPDQVTAFLSELLSLAQPKPISPNDQGLLGTRRLRSPFAMGFEQGEPAASVSGTAGGTTRIHSKPVLGAGFLANKLEPASPPPPDMPLPVKSNAVIPTSPAPIPLPSRRSTLMFEQNKPNVPTGGDGQTPVGERSVLKHEMVFGGKEQKPVLPNKPVVLIAEDDKRARMVYRLRIEAEGFSVIECEDGQEAWDRIQQGGIDAVVLDMKMPGMHGLEVLSAMAARPNPIPVVICSAYDQLEDEFVVKTYPKIKYLTKPVAPEKLTGAIRELIVPAAS